MYPADKAVACKIRMGSEWPEKRRTQMCTNWIELEDEYCKGKRKMCTCAGQQRQCDYPEFFVDRDVVLDKFATDFKGGLK